MGFTIVKNIKKRFHCVNKLKILEKKKKKLEGNT